MSKLYFKGVIILIIGLLIGTSILPSVTGNNICLVNTIIVPDDYPTIQEAIDAAHIDDMIYVRNGIYYENIVIDQPVSIIGENKENTIIDGSKMGSVVVIDSINITITGFSIQNSGEEYSDCGIKEIQQYPQETNNINITGNIIIKNGYGVHFNGDGINNVIMDNIFYENIYDWSII